MKIGILTTHRANNFGAMLQAYSLVMACRELGADTEIIDWRNPFFEKVYHKAWRMHRNPVPAIKHLIWFLKDERISREMFKEFRKQIPMSRTIQDKKVLSNIETEYDVFIVGSDQVWNPTISAINPKRFDRTYLLDFVETKKKYAYAASIGDQMSINGSLLSEYINSWNKFNGITMREKTGSTFVEDKIGKKVETVVDPVLLHNVEYWRNVETKGRFSKKNIALIYNLRRSIELMNVAKKVAEEQKLEIINLLIPAQTYLGPDKTESAGPAEMLEYIDSAECIFTGSFHAAAFSIIYGKKLYAQLIKNGENSNARMENLFSLCDLNGVNVYEDSSSFIKFYDCSLKNTLKLKNEIDKSRNILEEMIIGKY